MTPSLHCSDLEADEHVEPRSETVEIDGGTYTVTGGTAKQREEAVREMRASMQREQARRARWPGSNTDQMAALANLFPTMRGVPGTDPWNVEDLIAWLNSGAPTSGSRWAAMFLLGVWAADTDWYQYGLRKRKGMRVGKFDLFSAMAAWDYQHIQAMQEWVANPFWP